MAEPTSGNQLAQQFQACRPAFCAIGDETRQLILRVFIATKRGSEVVYFATKIGSEVVYFDKQVFNAS